MLRKQAPYNNPQDFSLLYEHAHLIVFRYIYSLRGGPKEIVEDLTAETFWRAWRRRKSFQGDQKAAVGWLLKIARRLVIDEYRRQKVRGFSEDIEEFILPDNGKSPEEQAANQEQLATLMDMLSQLPVQQREMLTLRYILGWRVKDIGAHMEIAENTVSVTIKRTLDKLRANWPVDEGN